MAHIDIGGVKRKLLCRKELPGKPKRFLALAPDATPVPEEVDLRCWSGPVLDQHAIGTCVDFATASMYMRLTIKEAMEAGATYEQALALAVLLSTLFLYYYARLSEGTDPTDDSGTAVGSPLKVLATVGCCTEATWDYSDYQLRFSEEPPPAAMAEAAAHKDLLDFDLPDQVSRQRSLADGFSFIVGISVYASIKNPQTLATGVMRMPGADEEPEGGHGVEICGYIKIGGDLYWIMKNSWGVLVGSGGYFFIPFGYPMWDAKTLRRATDAEKLAA